MADNKKIKSNISNKKSSHVRKSKKHHSKYDEKFVVNGTFEQLVKELVTPKK
jgi:hypothetical protein